MVNYMNINNSKKRYILAMLFTMAVMAFVMLGGKAPSVYAADMSLSTCEPDEVIGDIKIYHAEEMIGEAPVDAKTSEVSDDAMGSLSKGDVVARDWYAYGSRYFYQQLSSTEKSFYRAMYASCMYLLNTVDANPDSPANYTTCQFKLNGRQYSECLSRGFAYNHYGMTYEQASKVTLVFLYENPQFYFADARVITMKGRFYLVYYQLFSNSVVRAGYTNQIFDKIDADAALGATDPDPVSRIMTIQKGIADWTEYRWSIGNMGYGEYYDQSLYSYAVMKNSVCAGYSKATLAILRKAGFSALAVTSTSHAWNMVKVGPTWYNLDVTWNDQSRNEAAPNGNYFLVSDAALKSTDKATEHAYEAIWTTLGKPVCSVSYVNADSLKVTSSVHHDELDVKADFNLTYIASPEVTLSSYALAYNGKNRVPAVAVTINGQPVDASAYYLAVPATAKSVGTYEIYFEFKEESGYSGSVCLEYKVVPRATQIKSIVSGSRSFKINVKKVKKPATGYEVQYSLKKDFSKKKSVWLKGVSKTSKKIGGLKSKKKYYVRVRTYKTVDGTKYYSDWSKVKTVKTK